MDNLNDFRYGTSSSNPDKRKTKENGKKNRKDRKRGNDKSSKSNGSKASESRGKGPPRGKKYGCFLCDRPHRVKDCPWRAKLAALITQNESESETVEEYPRLNPLRVLNTITVDSEAPSEELMYVNVEVNGQRVHAILDTGASNNFISQRVVKSLGLTVAKSSNRIKVIGANARPIHGTVTTRMSVGTWEQVCTAMVLDLVEFDLIFGMGFFLAAKAVIVPHMGGMVICDGVRPTFVSSAGARQSDEPFE